MITFKQINRSVKEIFLFDDDFYCISFVGSVSQKKKFNDIDLIFISKQSLNKKIIFKTLKKIKNLNKLKLFQKSNIKINYQFGPVKYNTKFNDIVFHCMFYDKNSHINHVIDSPFTCYDWERTEINLKKKISEIFPVRTLMLSDFFKSNRNINQFIENLKQKKITCSKFIFRKDKIELIKFNKKVDKKNIYFFSRSVVFHTINNFLKYHYGKNKKHNLREINIFIKKNNLMKDINLLNYNFSVNLKKIIFETVSFLKKMKKYLNDYKNDYKKIIILRHFKTKYNKNIFIGQKLNPNVLEFKKNLLNKPQNKIAIYSSPSKRTIQTIKFLYPNHRIIIDQNLNEIDYGRVEGLDINSLKIKFPILYKKMINKKFFSYPDGESYIDLEKRIKIFFRKIITTKPKLNVVCTHNNFIRILIGSLFFVHKKENYKITVPYAKKIEFLVKNNKINPNFDRRFLYKFFKKII